jgi:hypothetical protein
MLGELSRTRQSCAHFLVFARIAARQMEMDATLTAS